MMNEARASQESRCQQLQLDELEFGPASFCSPALTMSF